MKGVQLSFTEQPKRSHHAKGLNPDAMRCRTILDALKAKGAAGAIPDELADELSLKRSQVSGALNELNIWGLAVRTDARRQTGHGGIATVWMAT